MVKTYSKWERQHLGVGRDTVLLTVTDEIYRGKAMREKIGKAG